MKKTPKKKTTQSPPFWTDCTGYSRSDTQRIPAVWQLNGTHHLRVTVHRWLNDLSTWYLSCRELGIERRTLGSDLVLSRIQAIEIIINTLDRFRGDIKQATEL